MIVLFWLGKYHKYSEYPINIPYLILLVYIIIYIYIHHFPIIYTTLIHILIHMSSWSSINLPNIFPTIFPTIIPRYSKDIPMNHQFLTMSHMHPSIQFHVIMWFPMISFVSSRLFHCHPTSACPVSYTHISIYTCIHIYIYVYIYVYIYIYTYTQLFPAILRVRWCINVVPGSPWSSTFGLDLFDDFSKIDGIPVR